MNTLLPIILLPLLLGTLLTAWCGRANTPGRRAATAGLAGAITLAALSLLLALAPGMIGGQPVLERAEWMPAIGLNAHLRLDGLSLLFALLITGVGALVVLYAAFYLGPNDPAGKFYAALMLFMAAMLGIVLSDNLLLLLVFWELTSLSSFLLIGYWGRLEASRAGARMALAVTGGGGLVLLAGILVLGQIAGTYDISEMAARRAEIQAHPQYALALGLILVGCFTKSAQLPFHFWLPEAMAAPTPVSAYLHSATMVKAGLFLMMRLYPVLGGTALFEGIVASVGLATMVFAAAVAVFRHDLKGLLAYSTVSHLGLVTFLIGLASPLSAVAAVFHVLSHASFKAALFMSAGIVDHETGTRDMRRLGGLARLLPVTATLATVAAAAMAGLPPFNGFISKELMLHEAVHAGLWGEGAVLVVALATLAGLFSAAYSLRLVHDTFFQGPPRDLPNPAAHEPSWGMRAPVLLLVLTSLAMGLAPMLLAGPLVKAAATAVLGAPPPAFELALWHGVNLPLALSVVALAGGALLYTALRRGARLHRLGGGAGVAQGLFQAGVNGLFARAGRLTAALENGSLQRHVVVMVVAALALAAWPLLHADTALQAGTRPTTPASPLALAVWLLLAGVCVALVRGQRQRYVAVVLAGAVGLVASLTFLAFSAPDLAMTQLSVDVASTVLLMMGLALLPQHSPGESSPGRRTRDAVLALAAGGGIAWLAWLVLTREFDSISWFFLEQSVPAGGGTNAVNVILVDFRGYDTFGEITVLGIAAVGVLALLDGLRVRRPGTDADGRPWSFSRSPLMLRTAARIVLPVALVVSAYVFWRGHGLPGGGFIAGLITAIALVLQYVAFGQARADAVLRDVHGSRYTRWIGIGLGIAWLTGVGAFAFGRPFLTSAHGHPVVPVLGELPLATAAIFDLGVYITVVGSTMLMLAVLGGAAHPARGGVRSGGRP